MNRGIEAVVVENVPTGENQVVETCQRQKFVYFGGTVVRPLAEPDSGKLCERSDRLGDLAFNGFDSSYESSSDRPHTRDQDPQLTGCRRQVRGRPQGSLLH